MGDIFSSQWLHLGEAFVRNYMWSLGLVVCDLWGFSRTVVVHHGLLQMIVCSGGRCLKLHVVVWSCFFVSL